MGKWYLVRHAKTAWNTAGRIQGHSESDLESEGIEQAQKLGARLASASLQQAYSSDMQRTRSTARHILRDRAIPYTETSELREMSYGKWEGMTHKEIHAAYGQQYTEYMRGDIAFAPPSGESAAQLLARLSPLVDRLRAQHANDDLLIVTHGGTMKGLLVLLMGLPPDLFWRFNVLHASVSQVTIYPDTATLDLWNDVSHLNA